MIPEGAEYYITEYGQTKYYREFVAFNMRMLDWYNPYSKRWEVCGYHPWDQLIRIVESNE